MLLSDFLHAQSTHALVNELFASEIGLKSVSHPTVQAEALLESFERLQLNAAKGVGSSFELALHLRDGTMAGVATITGRQEAQLFMELYRSINAHAALSGRALLPRALHLLVYPLVGKMLGANDALKDAVLAQLAAHCEAYGAAVAQRVLASLPKFGLTELSAELTLRLGLGSAELVLRPPAG